MPSATADFIPLVRHESSGGDAIKSVHAAAARGAEGDLSLHFVAAGDLDHVAVPGPAAPARADRLWEHTCFEAFIQFPVEGYIELNFSPSQTWAAYRFDGYRKQMAPLKDAWVEVRPTPSPRLLHLVANIQLPQALRSREDWTIGLSAVIEENTGEKGFWALRHPPGDPDFHHPYSFALKLSPPAVDPSPRT
jgi:hypothetical protein